MAIRYIFGIELNTRPHPSGSMNRKTLIGAMCATLTCAAVAFPNEPAGFRGISWGTPATAVPGLQESHEAGRELASKLGHTYTVGRGGVLKAYFMKGEKLSFGGIKVRSLAYNFYRGNLMSATLRYEDSTDAQHSADVEQLDANGQPMSPVYDGHLRIEQALRDNFGEPSESPGPLARLLKTGARRIAYIGATTRVVAECNRAPRIECTLTFSSVAVEDAAREEFERLAAEQSAARRVEQEAREGKGRPDF